MVAEGFTDVPGETDLGFSYVKGMGEGMGEGISIKSHQYVDRNEQVVFVGQH